MSENNVIRVDADEGGLARARAFVGTILDRRSVNDSIALEAQRLFEALFREIVAQLGEGGTQIEIGAVRELGRTDIRMAFVGRRFSLLGEDVSSDPDAKLIEAFADKVSCSYQGGCNVIRIFVSQAAAHHE